MSARLARPRRWTGIPRTLWAGFLDLLYPQERYCMGCRRLLMWQQGALCEACQAAMRAVQADAACPRCGRPRGARGCVHCLAEPITALDAAWAAWPHRDVARSMVHAFKYDGEQDACGVLAEGMSGVLREQGLTDAVLVPIALHAERLRERGFDQSVMLARAVSARAGLPVREALTRQRQTERQVGLGAQARHLNVQDAFAAMGLAGSRVVLVDDVRTTGATAEAAAQACKRAGAAWVALLTATAAVREEDG